MKNRFKYILNYRAVQVAIISFVLGTICLLLFKTSGDTGFVGIGYCFTLLAAVVNTVLLLVVLIHAIVRYKDYKEHLTTVLVVLANIPITFFYLNLL
jgi:hypothetical protein